jgi:HAE1 family hydrophobic/amphiphilic exporter-1
MLRQIRDTIASIPEIKVMGGLAGLNIVSFSNKANVGTMFISLKPWDVRKGKEHHVQAVIAKIRAKTSSIKEARILPIALRRFPDWVLHPVQFQLQQTGSTDSIQQFERVARNSLQKLTNVRR